VDVRDNDRDTEQDGGIRRRDHERHVPLRANGSRGGRDRPHLFPGRERRVSPSFSSGEYAEVVGAASRCGLTPAGFCAVAALAVARGETGTVPASSAEYEALRDVQADLFDLRTAVRRVGVNLNQAVAEMHATGTTPVWLETVAGMCTRTLARVDALTSTIHRRARRAPG
jgi:hypothetical protein